MAKIILEESVGRKGKNKPEDVEVIRNRLKVLGFSPGIGSAKSHSFTHAIELFQAICKGKTKLLRGGGVDGTVSKHGFTHRWLAAQNAPEWIRIYAQSGKGWKTSVDTEASTGSPYTDKNGGYGTTWIYNTIKNAANLYFQTAKSDYPPMWIRDCAPQTGGNAHGHGSHETGLDIDLRLPLEPDPVGSNNILSDTLIFEFNGSPNMSWQYLGTKKQRQNHLYLEAVEAQLKALVAQPLVSIIGYKDDITPSGRKKLHTRWRKVQPWKNHEHHFHVRITPPQILAGQIQ